MGFITRAAAIRKYKTNVDRLLQLESEGKLQKIEAKTVGFKEDKPLNQGRPAKWVYREEDVAKHVQDKPDARFVHAARQEAVVFDMLTEGSDVVEIVRRTRLDIAEVTRIRNIYLREKGGFVFPGEAVELAREYGFDNLGPKTIVPLMVQLLEGARANNRSKPKKPIRGLVEE